MTKDEIAKGLEELKAECVVCRNFQEAYAKGVPFKMPTHKVFIIPTIMLNKKFYCPDYSMRKECSDALFALGGKRTTRQIYERSKAVKVVSVWVFKE